MNSRRKFISSCYKFWLSLFIFNSCKATSLRSSKIVIGNLSDFDEGLTALDLYRIVVRKKTINKKILLSAMSKLCTHQSCLLSSDFICPCHGSQFSDTGDVLKGPAKKNLPYFMLAIDSQSQLTIDFSKIVNSDWVLELSAT